MSIALVRAIFESGLPAHLKATAAVLATFGHDGRDVYPGLDKVASMAGKTPRRVRADIDQLIRLGVLEVVTDRRGGRRSNGQGRPAEYRLHREHLPTVVPGGNRGRHAGPPQQPGRERPPYEAKNPDADVRLASAEPGRLEHETRTFEAKNPDAHVRRSCIDRSLIEEKRSPAAPALEAVHTPIAHAAIDRVRSIEDRTAIVEEFKTLCAKARIPYNSDIAHRAIDQALIQRQKETRERLPA